MEVEEEHKRNASVRQPKPQPKVTPRPLAEWSFLLAIFSIPVIPNHPALWWSQLALRDLEPHLIGGGVERQTDYRLSLFF